MNDYVTRFRDAPASFKKSFAMLAAAWICHPVFIYVFFYINQAVTQAESVIYRMAAISGCLCFLLFLIKKWARALVVMGNAFIVVYDLFVVAISPPNKILTLLCVGITVFTIWGTYWLFVKDSREYFNQVNPKIEPPELPDSTKDSKSPQ